MGRFQTQITVEGEAALNRGFNKVETEARDLRNFADEFKPILFASAKENMDSEGHGGWKPLSPAYEEIKIKKYGSLPILQATKALYKSLTSETGDTIFEVNENELVFGSSLPQFGFHMKGTKNMPARPPIDLTESDKAKLGRAGRKKLNEIIKKSGFETE